MENLKEALEYLVGLGEAKILSIGGHEYTTKDIEMVSEPKPETLQVTTLTALLDYIKANFDKKASERLLIHVASPHEVILCSELRSDEEREIYMKCKTILPDNINFDSFMDMEHFNIMLQSSFQDTNDKKLLLQVTGCIKEDAIKQLGDDGVSQAATIKTGVANVDDVKVPNPVYLAPFRTFPEIEQPQSKFIFRMRTGPTAALFEADGGMWRNEAMNRVKKYLADELKSQANISIIS